MISIETYVLSRKYTDKKCRDIVTDAAAEAIAAAVEQSNLYTDEQIGRILSFDIEILSTLPDNPNNHTLYLIPRSLKEDNNGYFEYIYVNNKWEIVGDTTIDLSDYYTKAEIDQLFIDNAYELPVATSETLGGIKLNPDVLILDENGALTISEEGLASMTSDIIQPIEDDKITKLFNNN